MTEEDDALWLGSVRDALEEEAAKAPASKLDDEARARMAEKALAAYAPKKRSNVIRLAWVAPVLAMAAALFLFLRRPGDAPFVGYQAEVSSLATERGPVAAAPSRTLTVAPGVPFTIVLRPEKTADDPVQHAYVFARTNGVVRYATATSVDVASTGAVRVSGDGATLANVDTLYVVLTRRASATEQWPSRLQTHSDEDVEYMLQPDARVFVVRVAR